MNKQEQFDFVSGKYEAEIGMALAESGKAAQEWKDEADAWFESLPIGRELTGDDLRDAVGVVAAGANKNNAVGAWFSGKAKQRRIRWTGRFHTSLAVSRHTNQHRIWIKVM